MREIRKNQHIALAMRQEVTSNDFDFMFFEHTSLPKYNYEDISLQTKYLNHTFDLPFYINAMTGGTKKAEEINEKLAKLAKYYGLAMAVGSQNIALENKEIESTFKVINKVYPEGFFIGNLSANAKIKDVHTAISMINAQAFQIHLNPIQELVMGEGDRAFKHWKKNIKEISDQSNIPIILKEVGFGMSLETINELSKLGVKYIDVSGKGGTNFARIENARVNRKDNFLESLGISTLDSLEYSKEFQGKIEFFSSGGIRNSLDIVKSLVLGAKAVGLSKFFLELITLEWEEQVNQMDQLISDIKKIMILLNAKNIEELKTIKYIIKK